MTLDPLRHLAEELDVLKDIGRLRERGPSIDSAARATCLNLCSNDYLGYRTTGRLAKYVREAAGTIAEGAGASRLVYGEHEVHRCLEEELSSWLGLDKTLLFTSGYAANVGTIAALAAHGDLIVSDALNHASLIDGCRLSRARVVVVAHNDLEQVRAALRGSAAKRRWVVTESYFSMEGDGPDLRALRQICWEHDAALVLDEAHAVGVLGFDGSGLAREAGVQPDVLIGTLGKSLASQGAFVAGSRDLVRWLWNRARSFVFSTGLSPLLAAIGLGAVREARADGEGRAHAAAISRRLREGLERLGLVVANQTGPLLPLVLGDEVRALAWSRALLEAGILVQAIRPPTVPAGGSRLRITARADLSDAQVEVALAAFAEVAKAVG
ncbi:MAG TPA: 8-amino-7-oxononanoate synthase [Polyangiaceae bacterium]|nr:8-amino-7-oxononanoate synthase [Polyangiaceae bacterium]